MKITVVSLYGTLAGCLFLTGCSKEADSKLAIDGPVGPVALKAKWIPGKKYAMHMELIQNTEAKMPAQQQDPVTIRERVTLTQNFDISVLKELDNGGWQFELEFVNQTLDVSQGQRKEISFDSAQDSGDSTNPVNIVLGKMIGAHLRYSTDANGKVEQMDGYDELVKRMPTPQTAERFRQMFGNEDLFKRYGSFAAIVPNQAVKAGGSWPVKDKTVTPIGLLDVTAKNTFKNWELHGDRKCVHIETISTLVPGSASADEPGQLEKGEFSSETWFDPELGMIVETIEHQTLGLKNSNRRMGGVSQKIDRTIRVALLDVADLGK